MVPLSVRPSETSLAAVRDVAGWIMEARWREKPIIWFIGGHVIKNGLSRHLIRLIQDGWVTHLAMNGSAAIHDWEIALVGGTSEYVQTNLERGEFGLWQETGHLCNAIRDDEHQYSDAGCGKLIGRYIGGNCPPHMQSSVLAYACWHKTPVTVHISIGQDVLHMHPNFDGRAWGHASHMDFLQLAHGVSQLDGGGVFLNFGSAVAGPEVFLKALSMARNVVRQDEQDVKDFYTAVFDIVPLPENCTRVVPDESDAGYYFRPWKSLLVRTVLPGNSRYVRLRHEESIPALTHLLIRPPH